MNNLQEKTISDFGDQWSIYTDNKGLYGSIEFFKDIITPLIDIKSIKGKTVVDIGSGTGRIVNILLEAGVAHVYAIEPSPDAFKILRENVRRMNRASDVTTINSLGHQWTLDEQVDYVFSIGVIHHIPKPAPVIKSAFNSLKPGGYFFMWVYGYEGNTLYLRFFQPLRKITTHLPHILLRGMVELLYYCVHFYKTICNFLPLPMHSYITNVFWQLSPQKRRLAIYDQLNPAFAKYYRKNEAIKLLEKSGFKNVNAYHRHGYSWSVLGKKPIPK